MKNIKKRTFALHILARGLIALVGGYYCSYLFAVFIAKVVLNNLVDDIATGMMLSFIVYTFVTLYVFAIKSTLKAFLGVAITCFMLRATIYFASGTSLL